MRAKPVKREALLARMLSLPGGAAIDELAPVMGLTTRNGLIALTELFRKLLHRGEVVWVHEPRLPRANQRRRYYATQFAPEVHGDASVKRAGTKVYQKKGPPRPDIGSVVPLHRKPAANAPVVSDVKPTICPAGKDHRFTVDKPTPYFSALAIGSYPPSDSWAAKVYG